MPAATVQHFDAIADVKDLLGAITTDGAVIVEGRLSAERSTAPRPSR